MPIGLGLVSLPTMLFNRPRRELLVRIHTSPIYHNNNDGNHDILVKRQDKRIKSSDTLKVSTPIFVGSTTAVQ